MLPVTKKLVRIKTHAFDLTEKGLQKVKIASAGNRTRIYCLEGNNANLYTTDADNEQRFGEKTFLYFTTSNNYFVLIHVENEVKHISRRQISEPFYFTTSNKRAFHFTTSNELTFHLTTSNKCPLFYDVK